MRHFLKKMLKKYMIGFNLRHLFVFTKTQFATAKSDFIIGFISTSQSLGSIANFRDEV